MTKQGQGEILLCESNFVLQFMLKVYYCCDYYQGLKISLPLPFIAPRCYIHLIWRFFQHYTDCHLCIQSTKITTAFYSAQMIYDRTWSHIGYFNKYHLSLIHGSLEFIKTETVMVFNTDMETTQILQCIDKYSKLEVQGPSCPNF